MSDERLAELLREVEDRLEDANESAEAHEGGDDAAVWNRARDFWSDLHDVLASTSRLRAPAQLGSALVDALRGVEALDPNDALVLFRDRYGVWRSGVSEDVAVCLTDATVAFDASLLAAFPQEDSRG